MAACVRCGTALPRNAAACPACGTRVARAARKPAAKKRAASEAAKKPATKTTAQAARAVPAAQAPARRAVQPVVTPAGKGVRTPAPVVKAVAKPVLPTVKGAAAPARATPKAAVPAARPAAPRTRRAPAAAPQDGGVAARATRAPAAAPPDGRATSRRRIAAARASAGVPHDAPADGSAAEPAVAPGRAPHVAAYDVAYDVVTEPAHPGRPAWRPDRPLATRSGSDVIGEAQERHPDDPVEVEGPPREMPPPVDLRFDADPAPDAPARRWPPLVRAVRGDWAPTLSIVLPGLLVTVVLAAVATAALTLVTTHDGEPFLGDTPGGRWFQYVFAAVGVVFGAPFRVRNETQGFDLTIGYDVRFAPLALTAACLVALWYLARRAHARNVTPDRLPDALRAAFVYAVGIGLMTRLARWETTREEITEGTGNFLNPLADYTVRSTYAVPPWRPMFWAFCAAFAVVWLATGRVVVEGGWATWLLAARGALAGLTAGLAGSFLLAVVLGYAYAGRAGAGSGDVTNALPVALAYAPGLAAGAYAVVSGGTFFWPVDQRHGWSLWAPWFPKWYLVLLVVPALSVAAGVYYLHRRSGAPAAEVVRACRRLALPAALIWLLVAVAGSAYLGRSGFGFVGDTVAGPSVWNALIVALWFGAGGRVAEWVLTRRGGAFDQPPDDT